MPQRVMDLLEAFEDVRRDGFQRPAFRTRRTREPARCRARFSL